MLFRSLPERGAVVGEVAERGERRRVCARNGAYARCSFCERGHARASAYRHHYIRQSRSAELVSKRRPVGLVRIGQAGIRNKGMD